MGRSCTFFGHRVCDASLEAKLDGILRWLVTQRDVDTFYVGNQGQFDTLVREALRRLKQGYPQISYHVVLAYPLGQDSPDLHAPDVLLPAGITAVPPRAAIVWRNEWMLRRSDMAVVWVTHPSGGAARFARRAQQMGKQIYNLARL